MPESNDVESAESTSVEVPRGAHRVLVETLGDQTALEQVGTEQWLDEAAWAEAVERARAARFGDLPRAQGMRHLGADIAERYLASDVGAALAVALPAMTADRLAAALAPLLAMRMRRGIVAHGEGHPELPRLVVQGRRSASPEITLGVFEVLARKLSTPCEVTLVTVEDELLELAFVPVRVT